MNFTSKSMSSGFALCTHYVFSHNEVCVAISVKNITLQASSDIIPPEKRNRGTYGYKSKCSTIPKRLQMENVNSLLMFNAIKTPYIWGFRVFRLFAVPSGKSLRSVFGLLSPSLWAGGFVRGSCNSLLDACPFVGWGKLGVECIWGDWFPDNEEHRDE